MKIAYHYHHEIKKYKNKYYCVAFWGKYVAEISKQANLTLVVWVREVDTKPKLFQLPKSVSVLNLGPKPNSFLSHFINLPKFRKIILNNHILKFVNYIGIEAPTFFAIYINFFIKNKFFIFLVGDMPACILTDRTNIFKKLILYMYYSIDKYFLIRICNKSVVFDENYKINNRGLNLKDKSNWKVIDKFLFIMNEIRKFFNKKIEFKDYSSIYFKDYYSKIKVTRHNMLMPTFYSRDIYFKPNNEYKNNVNNKIILTIFRLDQSNNIFSIIDIGEYLVSKTQNFKWLIIGDGPDKIKFKNLIQHKKLSKYFKIFGNIEHGDKFKNILKNSDIYVDPYLPNAPGPNRAAWEALSFGIPIIGGSSIKKDYLIHNKHIYYTQNDSSKGFSNAIFDLIENKKRRLVISKNASKIAKTRSLDKEIKRMIQILQNTKKI